MSVASGCGLLEHVCSLLAAVVSKIDCYLEPGGS